MLTAGKCTEKEKKIMHTQSNCEGMRREKKIFKVLQLMGMVGNKNGFSPTLHSSL